MQSVLVARFVWLLFAVTTVDEVGRSQVFLYAKAILE